MHRREYIYLLIHAYNTFLLPPPALNTYRSFMQILRYLDSLNVWQVFRAGGGIVCVGLIVSMKIIGEEETKRVDT
jgi:hypothetical protein